MFIEVLKIGNRRQVKCECDQCGKIFTKRYIQKYLDSNQFTFCSKKCFGLSKRSSGKSYQRSIEQCLKKYGVEHTTQIESVKRKSRQTCLEHYGVENPSLSCVVRKKRVDTFLKKFGVDNPWKSKEICKKIKNTNLEKYGVENVSQSEKIKTKKEKTCLEHYGVENPFQASEVKSKKKEKYLKNYGVDNPMKSKQVRDKVKKTCLKKYGVDHPLKSEKIRSKINYKLAAERCHETMKRNGSYIKSKVEDEFYEFLCEKFGEKNVERQARINEWNIDFYVKSIETYIQLDGVYWHGLDRSVEVIKESKNPRDKIILCTYKRDQEQNEWFKMNHLKFVRITDEEFRKNEICI